MKMDSLFDRRPMTHLSLALGNLRYLELQSVFYLFISICGVKTIFWNHNSLIFESADVSLVFRFFLI